MRLPSYGCYAMSNSRERIARFPFYLFVLKWLPLLSFFFGQNIRIWIRVLSTFCIQKCTILFAQRLFVKSGRNANEFLQCVLIQFLIIWLALKLIRCAMRTYLLCSVISTNQVALMHPKMYCTRFYQYTNVSGRTSIKVFCVK